MKLNLTDHTMYLLVNRICKDCMYRVYEMKDWEGQVVDESESNSELESKDTQ